MLQYLRETNDACQGVATPHNDDLPGPTQHDSIAVAGVVKSRFFVLPVVSTSTCGTERRCDEQLHARIRDTALER